MAGVRGRRKAMLLVGEGIDYDIYEAVGQSGIDGVVGAARYARRDRRGHPRQRHHLRDRSARTDDRRRGSHRGVQHGRRRRRPCDCQNELRLSQDSLRVLADATGGFAAVNRNDFNGAFDRIVAENSSYYMLGFYSTNDRRDGRYRKIEVRVKRPGLRVRSRATATTRRAGARPNQPAPSPNAMPRRSPSARQPAAGGRRAAQGVRGALQGRRRPTPPWRWRSKSTSTNLDFVEKQRHVQRDSSKSPTPRPNSTGQGVSRRAADART